MLAGLDRIAREADALSEEEATAIEEARKVYEQTYDELFIIFAVRAITSMLQDYHRHRLDLLGSIVGMEKLNNVTLQKWLAHRDRSPMIIGEWMLRHHGDLFQLPRNANQAKDELYKKWRRRLPGLTERLRQHPVMQGLPEIELVQDGRSKDYSFMIRFVI